MEIEKVTLFKNNITGLYYETEEDANKNIWCSSCGNNYRTKHRTVCQSCLDRIAKEAEKRSDEKFLAQEGILWVNIDVPVYDKTTEQWFDDSSEFIEYYDDNDLDISVARLVMGEIQYLSSHGIEDYISDQLFEDQEISDLPADFLEFLKEVEDRFSKVELGYSSDGNKKVIYEG
jgi:hypothetical protein